MKRPIAEVKENPNNPRSISKGMFDKLVQSIKDFPEMLEARLVEIDPKYCDVIIDRWEQYTGRKAILANQTQPSSDT